MRKKDLKKVLIYKFWVLYFTAWIYANKIEADSGTLKYTDWMSNLPKSFLNAPLTKLAIPGSHDSASYSLNTTEDLAPDVPKQLFEFLNISRNVSGGEAFLKEMVYRWSMTQKCNITQQLQLGIRYLDLRIIYKKGRIYTYHGLIGADLRNILQQIRRFIEKHKKELILLDFNHMLHMNSEGFVNLNSLLFDILGKRMCEYSEILDLTLKNMWKLKKNIIVFYQDIRSNGLKSLPKFAWNHSKIISPFKRESFYNTDTWLDFINYGYKHRANKKVFFVTQGILEPHWLGIATASISSSGTLEQWVSDDATKHLINWLHSRKQKTDDNNIVIADFIEKNHFIGSVLELNSCAIDANQQYVVYILCMVVQIFNYYAIFSLGF